MYLLIARWHFVIGIVIAPVLIVIALSGAVLAFTPQLQLLAEPWMGASTCDGCEQQPYQLMFENVQQAYPSQSISAMARPSELHSVQFSYFDEDGLHLVFVDPFSGEIVGERLSPGGPLAPIYKLHHSLFSGIVGRLLVELATSWMLVTVLLGVFLWWPSRRLLRGGWVPRLTLKRGDLWRDAHRVAALWFLPLFLLLAISGLFSSVVAGKTLMASSVAALGVPSVFTPQGSENEAGVSAGLDSPALDFFIEKHNQHSGSDQFFLLLPHSNGLPLQLSNDQGRYWGQYSKSWFDPVSGELLKQVSWSNLDLSSKLFIAISPLHTGRFAGIASQLLYCVAALVLALVSISGVFMWGYRRKQNNKPIVTYQPHKLWWLLVLPLLVIAPLSVVSMLCIVGFYAFRQYVLARFLEQK